MMIYCCVPGCRSKSSKKTPEILFFSLPTESNKGLVDLLKKRRRREWLRAIEASTLPEDVLKNARVCSRHFVSGRPATNNATFHVDWVPNLNLPGSVRGDSVEDIITNLPEVTEEFDVPEYITFDEYLFNEKQIESDLIHKYITNPICDERGYYRNDHDYLGLPIIRKKTDRECTHFKDHNYSIDSPACLYSDLRHFCNICRCNNRNLFSFNSHMMGHTMKNDVTCSICGQYFLTTTCLHNHLSFHTTICEVCGSEVPVVQIEAHQDANAEQKRSFVAHDEYKVAEDERINFCIFCMKGFVKKSDYFEHSFKHGGRIRVGKAEVGDKKVPFPFGPVRAKLGT